MRPCGAAGDDGRGRVEWGLGLGGSYTRYDFEFDQHSAAPLQCSVYPVLGAVRSTWHSPHTRMHKSTAHRTIRLYCCSHPSSLSKTPYFVSRSTRPFSGFSKATPRATRPATTVLLGGGRYQLEGKTITLGPEDGGRAGAPVVWAAEPGETPIISGATK